MIKQQVIEARKNGYSYSQIKKEFGVAKSTARDWVSKDAEEDCEVGNWPTWPGASEISRKAHTYSNLFDVPLEDYPEDSKVVPYVNPYLNRDTKKRFNKSEAEVLEFLEQLAPIENLCFVPDWDEGELTDYAVVFSDLHFPLHCEKSISILFQTIKKLKPSKIILNGDSCDILSLSRFPKDILKNYTLLDERLAYQKFLKQLIEISNGAEIFETNANHSSGGPESRWRRYLSERIPELGCLPEVMEALSYENIFLGELSNYIEMCDYVDLNGLYVMHGTTVRKNPASSVMGEMERFRASIMMGHVHRMGSVSMRQPAIGTREEKQLVGYEIGCMCDLNPLYCSAPNWTNGFAIVALGEDTFGVELVSIVNGTATIASLGETLYA